MIDCQSIIDFYYPATPLRDILLRHSRSVADKAVAVADKHPELNADRTFVYNAAMLHDIGIIRTDAPGIQCFGTEPYLKHGLLGAEMIREHDFGLTDAEAEALARVCARHTGTGLTAKTIRENNLPLPERDFTPETTEEQIVCYADKFFSKTKLDTAKTYEQVLRSFDKFGEECADKFAEWHRRFG